MKTITFDGVPAEQMTRQMLIAYTIKNKNRYVSDLYAEGENGTRLYDCLYGLVQDDSFSAKDLHEHGMSDNFLL